MYIVGESVGAAWVGGNFEYLLIKSYSEIPQKNIGLPSIRKQCISQ